ncbi:MAG: hypothetical protein JJLCMIEE_02676 [Acidimicrobiales bacterium]|nr:MAG: hypothetical protein EDR02_09160 [Actinomycetota bacterium]MBV6509582.1 hypothetical protein [Acidimicrobiales bacterium]RIK06556.1 MAG: hypothetical protein DCC48_06485 [Acidobacteriota bacterium]
MSDYDQFLGHPPEEKDVKFWPLWKSDILRLGEAFGFDFEKMGVKEKIAGLAHLLTIPGVLAVGLFRVASALNARGGFFKIFSRLVYLANYILFGTEMAPSARVGPGLVVPHPMGVGIGHGVRMGSRVSVFRFVGIGGSPKLGSTGKGGLPVIGDDVWLMDSSAVAGGVTIHNKVIVGAKAAVNRDVPPGTFVFPPRPYRKFVPLNKVIPRRVLDAGVESAFVKDHEAAQRRRRLEEPPSANGDSASAAEAANATGTIP